jgi:hypothetical protein
MKNDLMKLAKRLNNLGLRDEARVLAKVAQMTDADIVQENIERSKTEKPNYFEGGERFVSTYLESVYGVKNTPQEFKDYAIGIGYNANLVSRFLASVKPYDPKTSTWEDYTVSLESLANSLGITDPPAR